MNDTLESLIDSNSLAAVLSALFEVCHDKAEHVQVNWQDKELAQAWRTVAKRIDAAESTASKFKL